LDFAPATRRQFLRVSATGIGGAILGVGAYAALVEPEEVRVERVRIHLPNLADAFDGLKIVQLSDLHYGPFTGNREIGRAVARANAENPDLVVLTGDFVTARTFGFESDRLTDPALTHAVLCANLLGQLRAPLGVFAVLGNHDSFVNAFYVAEVLGFRSVRVLRNARHALERGSARLWLAGVEDVLQGSPRLDLALKGIPAGEPTVLLVHEPDFADFAARLPVHLQLSGHSHGGQVRLPLLGSPYLPPLARKYPYGYYRVGRMQLYTNRGIGTIMVPLRFDAPPEVTVFTLHAASPTTPT
jgi:predicted MPP superfamily phosphohydrolase